MNIMNRKGLLLLSSFFFCFCFFCFVLSGAETRKFCFLNVCLFVCFRYHKKS